MNLCQRTVTARQWGCYPFLPLRELLGRVILRVGEEQTRTQTHQLCRPKVFDVRGRRVQLLVWKRSPSPSDRIVDSAVVRHHRIPARSVKAADLAIFFFFFLNLYKATFVCLSVVYMSVDTVYGCERLCGETGRPRDAPPWGGAMRQPGTGVSSRPQSGTRCIS
jgi:hypothetical protein